MKKTWIRVLALLCAVAMLFPLAACATTTESDTGKDEQGTSGDEAETTGRQPTVEKKDYDADFNIIYCSDIFRHSYYVLDDDEREAGNELDDRVYERQLKIKDYLGVNVVGIDGGNYLEYGVKVKTAVDAGDDEYQLVLTHVYLDVGSMIVGNYYLDFNMFDSLQLDEDYWNKTLMEQLTLGDAIYCGYNDFCLSNCYVLGFNKEMIEKYPTAGNLYDLVRNKEWTLDKMIEIAELVSQDSNGDGKYDENDTYGFSGMCWVPLISFVNASDMSLLLRDPDTDQLYVSPLKDTSERYLDLTEKLYNLKKSNCSFMWGYDGGPTVHLDSNRVLMQMINIFDFITYKEQPVKIGVLPYPMYDTKQSDYRTLNWNGVMCVPSTVAGNSADMVGDTMEMLAFYSDEVKIAFYENLLGAKVADAPDDVDMLNIIWATQVTDLGLAFADIAQGIDPLLYAMPKSLLEDTTNVSSKFTANVRTAEKGLKKVMTQIEKNQSKTQK